MKKIISILIIALTLFSVTILPFSCESTPNQIQADLNYKYYITVDDGNGNGIFSKKNYKTSSYEYDGLGGVRFITLDGKEHFTTHKVTITER